MRQVRSRSEIRETARWEDVVLEESSVVALLTVGADGAFIAANKRMRELLGLAADEPLASRRLQEFLVNSADWDAFRNATALPRAVRLDLRSAAGSIRRLEGDLKAGGEGSARRVTGLLIGRDHEDRLHRALAHSARTEALGSLTAGVAHDFNNLLTVLVGNLYLIGEEVRDHPKVFEKLRAARDAGKRGTELIKQLMAFARREEFDVGITDPVRVIEHLVPLVKRALGQRIELTTRFQPGVGSIHASTAQLESVIVNLAVNARDAIEARGHIEIDVRSREIAAAELPAFRLAHAGDYVAISVADSGGGIPPELLDRVFDPLFSTKSERGGTGLGLTMVRWFAEQAGGTAQIRSALGQGTTVTLLLPCLASATSDQADKTMPLSVLPTGNERVVVLAPDEALRATLHETLIVLGYDVKVASGVEDMLAAVRSNDVELLLVDGLGPADADVLIRARAANPGLKVIMTAEAARGGEASLGVRTATLTKPFTLADLANAARLALDGS